jgi:hypothetical protein
MKMGGGGGGGNNVLPNPIDFFWRKFKIMSVENGTGNNVIPKKR